MVGLFDMLPFYIGAACLGVAWAMRLFEGTIWRWPVTLMAGLTGWILCRLLFQGVGKLLDLTCQKKLRSLPLAEISRRIGDVATPEWNLALLELKARGESLTEPRARLINLLGDESSPSRLFAFRALYEVFPQDVEKMEGYSPYESPEKCREKAGKLKNTENSTPENTRQKR